MSDIKQHIEDGKAKLKHEAVEETQQFLDKSVKVKWALIAVVLAFIGGCVMG